MTGQGSRLAFGPAVGPTHFNPYKTLKRRFSPLVEGEYRLSDVRNLYSRLTVTSRNLSGYRENFCGFSQCPNQQAGLYILMNNDRFLPNVF